MTFCGTLSLLVQQHDNMSKYRLAEEIGVHQTTIKNWLEGNTVPSASDMNKIAVYFDVSVDYLLGKTDKKEKPDVNIELSEQEKHLIEIIRTLSPKDVNRLEAIAQDLLRLK